MDLQTLTFVLGYYHQLTDTYPTTEQGLEALARRPADAPPGWRKFMDGVPRDPWGNPYVYRFPSVRDPASFDLFSLGPDRMPSADDIHAKPCPTATPGA